MSGRVSNCFMDTIVIIAISRWITRDVIAYDSAEELNANVAFFEENIPCSYQRDLMH